MLLGAIHRAVVTHVDFEGLDGLVVDAELARAAGFLEHEKVELQDVSSGTRLACQLRYGEPGTGRVESCGAVALLIKPGDQVSLATYGWMKAKPAAKHQPRIVNVDQDNRLAGAGNE